MEKVTLSVRTVPYEDETIDGNRVIGEVKRGNEVLYTTSVITNDSIESVTDVKEQIGLLIEIWAVENTDFLPTEDALPV